MRKKKNKTEKPRLIKVSFIDCVNGNTIKIGQVRRDNDSEPIIWEYEVISSTGETLHNGQNPDRFTAFNEALKIATNKC